MHVVTELDPETGAIFARNSFRTDFAARVAFADVDRRPRTVTTDRVEFVGRHGSMMAPAALGRTSLSGTMGEALDPAPRFRRLLIWNPARKFSLFSFWARPREARLRNLIQRYREDGQAERTLQAVREHWDSLLQTIQVRTPEPALDLMMNRWLIYQVLSCRFWGRSAFYQSGGAYGFRDQLQDALAFIHAAPRETRAHILRAAGRQFAEGDVQHWWHPPEGRGIRTRIADDPLWLTFIVGRYVAITGDSAVLDESVVYLNAPVLRPDQNDDYGLPKAGEPGSLYDHCCRALTYTNRLGAHGLPLMDHGDWNDGMNRVGYQGKGESIWLAWFQITSLNAFITIAESRQDTEHASPWRQRVEALRAALEKHGWDGAWYRRAYFDNGTPLGSAQNDACTIDSLAQTWAVISGAADPERARQAMKAVDDHLVRHHDRLILLFTPPFDHSTLDPGYVKGYLPGIRENGGQYTHGSVWVLLAAAMLGQKRQAFELMQILNPILHARDAEGVARYQVEPYVLAGDIYSTPPHVSRGGWTWYSGSAGWYYQVVLESILGFKRRGDRLVFEPCVPAEWSNFEIAYRFGSAAYAIKFEDQTHNQAGKVSVWLDGALQEQASIPLVSDDRSHEVRVVIA